MTQKPLKILKPWHMGTHLRAFNENIPMETITTSFKWFSNCFCIVVFWTIVAFTLEGLNNTYLSRFLLDSLPDLREKEASLGDSRSFVSESAREEDSVSSWIKAFLISSFTALAFRSLILFANMLSSFL